MVEDRLETIRESSNNEGTEERSEDYLIEVNNIKAAALLKIPVWIKEKKFIAMIDSGAEESYVNVTLINELEINYNKSDTKVIRGYGNNRITTNGKVTIQMKISGMNMEQEFQVLENSNMKYDLILGMNFLKKKKVSIDMKKRIIRIGTKNEENCEFKLSDENEIIESRHDKIPVYCAHDLSIKSNSNCQMNIVIPNFTMEDNDFYFEGNNHGGIMYYCGVISNPSQKVFIENNTKKTKKIKEGDKIGEISRIIKQELEEE